MDWMMGVEAPRPTGAPPRPSVEELRIVWLLAEGRTDEFVARRLGCTRRTLQRRFRRILEKLGADSRFQAGVMAERAGWLAAGSDGPAHSRQDARQDSFEHPTNNDRGSARPTTRTGDPS